MVYLLICDTCQVTPAVLQLLGRLARWRPKRAKHRVQWCTYSSVITHRRAPLRFHSQPQREEFRSASVFFATEPAIYKRLPTMLRPSTGPKQSDMSTPRPWGGMRLASACEVELGLPLRGPESFPDVAVLRGPCSGYRNAFPWVRRRHASHGAKSLEKASRNGRSVRGQNANSRTTRGI